MPGLPKPCPPPLRHPRKPNSRCRPMPATPRHSRPASEIPVVSGARFNPPDPFLPGLRASARHGRHPRRHHPPSVYGTGHSARSTTWQPIPIACAPVVMSVCSAPASHRSSRCSRRRTRRDRRVAFREVRSFHHGEMTWTRGLRVPFGSSGDRGSVIGSRTPSQVPGFLRARPHSICCRSQRPTSALRRDHDPDALVVVSVHVTAGGNAVFPP